MVMSLVAILVILTAIIASWQGGAMGFLQAAVEGGNVLSISILAIFIGSVFILTHRLGLSLGYVEEIGQSNG